jgi:hypothetical protein
VQNIRILEPTLEEIFLAYYGNNTDVRQQKETV